MQELETSPYLLEPELNLHQQQWLNSNCCCTWSSANSEDRTGDDIAYIAFAGCGGGDNVGSIA